MLLGVLASSDRSLEPVLGQPLLARQIERLGRCRKMDALVVVTGAGQADDIAALCDELAVPCHRSEQVDILDRVYEATRAYSPAHVVSLEGNRPLTNPGLVDEVVDEHLDGDHDHTSTSPPPSYPRGLEVEALRYPCLEEAFLEATPPQRQSLNRFFLAHPDRYATGVVSAESDYSRYRWIVEEPSDLELINRIYASLYPVKPDFGWRDALALCEHRPEWEARAPVERDVLDLDEGEISA